MKVILLAAALAMPAAADDVKTLLETAREGVKTGAAAPEAKDVRAQFTRTERDCASITFRPGDPTTSERVHLESRMYEERCYGGGGRYGEGRNCYEEWVRTERRSVRVEVEGRGEMLPWERDVFEVCLDGQWLSAWTRGASHEYRLETPGYYGDLVTARAVRKVASDPDPTGLYAESFAYDPAGSNFTLSLRDRWAAHYAGETVTVELELKKHVANWFDPTLGTKSLSLPVGETTAIRLADHPEFAKKLEAGKKYYARWRFKRVGKVSKDSWQGWWESGQAEFGRTALVAASFEKARACFLRTIERDECVYSCRDGSEHRMPVRQPDPWDRDRPVIACPQVVFPF